LKRPYDIILAGIVILLADLAAAAKGDEQSTSPYATAADLFKYAMKLREQALLKVEPPTRPAIQRFPWKTNIVTTVFWVGEQAGANNPVSNYRSSWDANWTGNYGGLDNPDSSTRRNCIPVAFIPRQNPFYCALPYNDVMLGQFKPEAPLVIPWFKQAYRGTWSISVQGSLGCYSKGKSHLLRAMGRLRPISHGSFPIRVPK
jgi:hypothetical protein